MPRTTFIPRPGVIRLTIHRPIEAPRDEADRNRVIARSFEAVQSSLPASCR